MELQCDVAQILLPARYCDCEKLVLSLVGKHVTQSRRRYSID
jgi:hypothetical protein